jgi:hypothetical protein
MIGENEKVPSHCDVDQDNEKVDDPVAPQHSSQKKK